MKELLDQWPELCKSCDSTNTSPLYSAAVQDHLDVVNVILDADVSSLRIVRKNGKTSLHTAARYGLLRIVKVLIERDPGIVCIKDKKGQTALHMAVKGQCPDVVEELLAADHSILNERDKKGNTAVHMATRKCRPQVCFYCSFHHLLVLLLPTILFHSSFSILGISYLLVLAIFTNLYGLVIFRLLLMTTSC